MISLISKAITLNKIEMIQIGSKYFINSIGIIEVVGKNENDCYTCKDKKGDFFIINKNYLTETNKI